MKLTINKCLVVAFLGSLEACAHKKLVPGVDSMVTKPGVVSVWSDWVKPKDSEFDLHLHIRNESEESIIVLLSDMSCTRGDHMGTMKYTLFNSGERYIDLHSGQDKNANMVCKLGGPVKGDFKVTIRRVYANPSQDGKTTGKILAKDIVWKFADQSVAE